MDEYLQAGQEGLLQELEITALKNNVFKGHGIYIQISDGELVPSWRASGGRTKNRERKLQECGPG